MAKVTGEMGEHRVSAGQWLFALVELLANRVVLNPPIGRCLAASFAFDQRPGFNARVIREELR